MAEQQKLNLVQRFAAWLAKVTAVDVGKENDGLVRQVDLDITRGPADKSWGELQAEFQSALEAWRNNPLARRLIGLITSYVAGDGIDVRSSYGPLNKFVGRLWSHPENNIKLRQGDWCDELARSGELFLILFPTADGLHYVRAMPASQIESIDWQPGDYEAELVYHEVPDGPGEDGRLWYSPRAVQSKFQNGKPLTPVMLHFAVNRPVGATRGESDLAPILVWMRRYSRWLEDRVRLNAAVRSFLWIVSVPGRLVDAKASQYRQPPEPGSVMVIDKDSEAWTAVAPDLKAGDAKEDGRAIRSMIVAGGPGTGLTDIGEAETSNLATAKEMSEQRRRFLRRRQTYFGYVLSTLTVTAWNRAQEAGLVRGRAMTSLDVVLDFPDISVEDNSALADAAQAITTSLTGLQALFAPSEPMKRLALRLYLKFAGETIEDDDFEEIINTVAAEPVVPPPAPAQPEDNETDDGATDTPPEDQPPTARRSVSGAQLAQPNETEDWPGPGVRNELEDRALQDIGEGLRMQSQGLRRPASVDPVVWQTWVATVPPSLATNGLSLEMALAATLRRSATRGAQTAAQEIQDAGVDGQDPDQAALEQWAVEMSRQLGAEINATTAAQIAELVRQYEEQAANVEDDADRETLADALWIAILALFGLARAALIGITETTRGLHNGWLRSWIAAIGDIRLEIEPPRHPRCRCWLRIQRRPGGGWQALWLTESDERVCPLCGPLHMMEVGGTTRV